MILGWVFLVVAIASLGLQSGSLTRLARGRAGDGLAARGLLRTCVCRVVGAVAYVGLAAVSLIHPGGTAVLAVATFTAVQFMWFTNSVLDVRLRRHLERNGGCR